MARCTRDGLLYGGPNYFAHGDLPCIHHTFTHAKALATVLDRGSASLAANDRLTLPRDEPYGLKTYPEIGTHLAAVGDWRATVTEYDWEYVEHVQAGGGGASGGGHASGGAMSLLFHRTLGPLLVASMTEYQMIEISNQQAFREGPHMPLTPRIEIAGDRTYTSLSDLAASLRATRSDGEIAFDAHGRMLTSTRQSPAGGDINYRLMYRLTPSAVEITASANTRNLSSTSIHFILPVVSPTDEPVNRPDSKTIQILKPRGSLTISTDAAHGFETVPKERTFNLVPGFECVPISLTMQPGVAVRIRLEAS